VIHLPLLHWALLGLFSGLGTLARVVGGRADPGPAGGAGAGAPPGCCRRYRDDQDGVAQGWPGSRVRNCPTPLTGGTVKNIPYSYTLDTAADVKSIVTAGAGTGELGL
jgi:hypothetical protein